MDNTDSMITVEIDMELMPVVPEYLANRQRECVLIEELLVAGRMDEIQSLGHRMKGSGGSYGFDEISEIGEVLELAAQGGEAQTIRSALSVLEKYLSRVKVVYI
jgi:HPt (histidine-containing phosphotransfer) domain-containing protein